MAGRYQTQQEAPSTWTLFFLWEIAKKQLRTLLVFERRGHHFYLMQPYQLKIYCRYKSTGSHIFSLHYVTVCTPSIRTHWYIYSYGAIAVSKSVYRRPERLWRGRCNVVLCKRGSLCLTHPLYWLVHTCIESHQATFTACRGIGMSQEHRRGYRHTRKSPYFKRKDVRSLEKAIWTSAVWSHDSLVLEEKIFHFTWLRLLF